MSTDRGLNREGVREFIVRPALLLQKLAGDDLKQQTKFLNALRLGAHRRQRDVGPLFDQPW